MCIKPTYSIENLSEEYLQGLGPIAVQIAKDLHSGKLDAKKMPKELVKALASELMSGISFDFNANEEDYQQKLANTIQQNIFIFSGFKAQKQLKEASLLLFDSKGKIRPYNDFLKDVLAINKTYNVNYLKAEYDNAVVSSQMISKWHDYQANKDVAPYLKFDATMDDHTTAICKSLDGVIKHIDDAFWKTYWLPLHWHERSDIIQITDDEVTETEKIDLPQLQPTFKNNVGISGIIFPMSHPYFKQSVEDGKLAAANIARQALDLLFKDESRYTEIYANGKYKVRVHYMTTIKEQNKNLPYAKALADSKVNVDIAPNTNFPSVKNPDAIIGNIATEFKEILPTSNITTSIENHLRNANDQGVKNVVIFLQDVNYSLQKAINGLRAIQQDRNDKIENVWLYFKDRKKLVKLNREEILKLDFSKLPK